MNRPPRTRLHVLLSLAAPLLVLLGSRCCGYAGDDHIRLVLRHAAVARAQDFERVLGLLGVGGHEGEPHSVRGRRLARRHPSLRCPHPVPAAP